MRRVAPIVATAAPGRDRARLTVRANGIQLWNRPIPPDPWSRSLDLAGVALGNELVVELDSDTFCPADTPDGSTDHRTLGIMVRQIRLIIDRQVGHPVLAPP